MPKIDGKGNSRLFILNTGGTLGMEFDRKTKAYSPAKSAANLMKGLKIPKGIRKTLKNMPTLLDSTNVNYEDRVLMAESIAEAYDDNDAFIILHGTDSIAYTAAGITMIFKETMQKPIIIVGSQMTKDEAGTDMRIQLENAVRIADEFSDERTQIAGVFALASGEVFNGARLRKTHDAKFAFLDTPGMSPVATIEQPKIEIKHDLVRRTDDRLAIRGLRMDKEFEPRVVSISVNGATPPTVLTSLVDSGAVKGVIIEALGSGNVPDTKNFEYEGRKISWIDAIRKATRAGIYVGIVSPFADGKVNLDRYTLGKKAKKAGVMSLESLTPAMADAKFRQAIALYPNDPQGIQKYISTDLAGELLRGKKDEKNRSNH